MADPESHTPSESTVLTKSEAIKQGHKNLGQEGRVQERIPGFDVEPFDPHKQFVEEEEISKLERLKKGDVTLRELARENQDAQLALEQQRDTDPLTGLKNRRVFQKQLKHDLSIATRDGVEVGLLMGDLDFFKRINDTFGHPKGDELLKATAQIMSEMFKRSSDTIARIGGEEFALILVNHTPKDEEEAKSQISFEENAQRLRHVISEELKKRLPWLEGQTLSIGLAKMSDLEDPRSEEAASQLYEMADKALYAAKHGGRNQVVDYSTLQRNIERQRLIPPDLSKPNGLKEWLDQIEITEPFENSKIIKHADPDGVLVPSTKEEQIADTKKQVREFAEKLLSRQEKGRGQVGGPIHLVSFERIAEMTTAFISAHAKPKEISASANAITTTVSSTVK